MSAPIGLMGYLDMVLLTLLVPVVSGIALIVTGVRDRTKLGLWYGVAHVFVLTPLVVNELPYGWQPSILVGKILVVAFIVLWAAAWTTKSVKVVALGALGVAGFAAHVYLIANSP